VAATTFQLQTTPKGFGYLWANFAQAESRPNGGNLVTLVTIFHEIHNFAYQDSF